MLLKQTSQEFRTLFVIEFTKELIKNSKTAETIALEKQLREKIKQNIKEKQEQKELYNVIKKRNLFPTQNQRMPQRQMQRPSQIQQRFPTRQVIQRPMIPQPRLPPTVQNITPQATSIKIGLGKLNPLLRDTTVTAIECSGNEKNILVRRGNQIRTTSIKLSEEEINDIIEKFAKEARIPIEEGIMKLAVGNLIMTAIISEVVDTKFIIEKMGLNSRRF